MSVLYDRMSDVIHCPASELGCGGCGEAKICT